MWGGVVIGAYIKRLGVKLSSLFSGGGVLLSSQKVFLAAVSLAFAATGLSGIFINTFIYSCTVQSAESVSGLGLVAYYNLCMYASMAFFSIVIGIVGKSLNSRSLMSFGLLINVVLFVMLLILREQSIHYVWLLGILSGMVSAMFNLNYGVAVSHATSNNNREYYLVLQGSINGFSTIVTPLIASALLDIIGGINGYITLFSIVLILSVVSLMCFFNLHFNDGKKGMTQFGNVFVAFVKDKSLRSCAIAEFVGGLRDGIVVFLLPMLIFTENMANMPVGLYVFAFSLVQVLFSHNLQSKIDKNNRNIMLFLSCIAYALIGLIFLSGTDMLRIYSYGIVSALIQSIFVAAVFSIFFEASYKIRNAQRKNLEILSVKEFYTNLGRLVGTFVFLLVSSDTAYIVYTLNAVGIMQLVAWKLMHKSTQIQEKEDDGNCDITVKLG